MLAYPSCTTCQQTRHGRISTKRYIPNYLYLKFVVLLILLRFCWRPGNEIHTNVGAYEKSLLILLPITFSRLYIHNFVLTCFIDFLLQETAELKSAVILRWLTVEIIDEMTFTFELRPWQHLFFPSDPQVGLIFLILLSIHFF